jgi:hypothetical protein
VQRKLEERRRLPVGKGEADRHVEHNCRRAAAADEEREKGGEVCGLVVELQLNARRAAVTPVDSEDALTDHEL